MKVDRKNIVVAATRKALNARVKAKLPLDTSVCIYDLAECLGADVWFVDIPSMEGVYLPDSRRIIVSSLRPAGRQVFTCAHELGHDVHGHGEKFDELLEQRSENRRFETDEFAADCFAGLVLMPKVAVTNACYLRGVDGTTCGPEAIYEIASWFGVGYTTLLHHMHGALRMLSPQRLAELEKMKKTLPAIRAAIAGRDCPYNLVVAHRHWTGRAIDLAVDDMAMLPGGVMIEGSCVQVLRGLETQTLVAAVAPGIGRASVGTEWASYIRVCRKNYVGRAKYRFLEEVDDADCAARCHD